MYRRTTLAMIVLSVLCTIIMLFAPQAHAAGILFTRSEIGGMIIFTDQSVHGCVGRTTYQIDNSGDPTSQGCWSVEGSDILMSWYLGARTGTTTKLRFEQLDITDYGSNFLRARARRN